MNVKYIFHFFLIASLIYAGSLVSMEINTHEQLFTQSLFPLPPLFDIELDNLATPANIHSTSMSNTPPTASLLPEHQDPLPVIPRSQALNLHNGVPQFPFNFNALLAKKIVKKPRHTKGDTYLQCQQCSYGCLGKQALGRHIAAMHAQNMSCRFCAETFNNRKNRYLHEKDVHLQEFCETSPNRRTFIRCPQCTMSYFRIAKFKKHMFEEHKLRPQDVSEMHELMRVRKILQ